MKVGDTVHSVLMLNLTEEDNSFLHPNICKYCIDYLKDNLDKTNIWQKRHRLYIGDTIDPTLKNVVNYYKPLIKNYYLINIELIYWPMGEYHDWHKDNGYKNPNKNYYYTTITYLNSDYEGGRTIVQDKTIEPTIGKIIKFDANIMHMVTQLTKGKRYVIVAWYNKNGKDNSIHTRS